VTVRVVLLEGLRVFRLPKQDRELHHGFLSSLLVAPR
jgi:hypothetical protein